MADPQRLRTMIALTTLIASVRPEDSNSTSTGFNFNLENSVFRGRNAFGDGDPLPMVSILEMPVAADQLDSPPESNASSGPWDLLIQGFVKDDKENPTDEAYRLAADVVRVLAIENSKRNKQRRAAGFAKGSETAILGILTPNGEPAISRIRIGSPVCRPPDEVSSKTYFWLRVSLDMVEDLENPYA